MKLFKVQKMSDLIKIYEYRKISVKNEVKRKLSNEVCSEYFFKNWRLRSVECRNPSFLGCLEQVSTLKRSWNKILNRTSLQKSDEKTHIESFTEDLDQFRFNTGDFQQWIESNPSFQILNDEEIMQTIQDRNREEQC